MLRAWPSGGGECAALHLCHGWEVRDRRVGVMSTRPAAVHQALLFRQLTGHVTVLEHTGPPLTAEQRAQLDAVGIAVVRGEVVAVESAGDHVTGFRLADGTVIALDAVVVAPICYAHADLLAPLGLHPAEFRAGDALMGTYVSNKPGGATSVAGVYVAGNVADVQEQVISAAAAGLTAAATINGVSWESNCSTGATHRSFRPSSAPWAIALRREL